MLAVDDATNEIGAAWGIKELLRRLLAAPTRHDGQHRLFRFYEAVLAADMPETVRRIGRGEFPHVTVTSHLGMDQSESRAAGTVRRVITGFRRLSSPVCPADVGLRTQAGVIGGEPWFEP